MGYGYGTSDARGYVNARTLREERSVREPEPEDIPRVTAAERREALAVAAAVVRPGEYDPEDLEGFVPIEPTHDRLGRPVGRGFGGVFDEEYDRPEDL